MYQDDDPIETSEWLDALESLIENEGVDRAKYILERLSERASRDGTELPYSITTPFRNSIPVSQQAPMPGDLFYGAPNPLPDPLECHGHGYACQPASR